jgi:hypothetical protein
MAQTDIDIDAALKAEHERLTSRKQEIEAELEYINQRLARMTAYFGATATPSQINAAATAGDSSQLVADPPCVPQSRLELPPNQVAYLCLWPHPAAWRARPYTHPPSRLSDPGPS